jgi:uracil phosphoribosyltransferase
MDCKASRKNIAFAWKIRLENCLEHNMKNIYIVLLLCVSCTPLRNRLEVNREEEPTNIALPRDNLIVMNNNPLVQNYLSHLRNQNTKSGEFKRYVKQISGLLFYKATECFPMTQVRFKTPMEETVGKQLDPSKKVLLIPILRAGLGMVSAAERMIPDAVTLHLGMYRDEKTHNPVWYYNKLPQKYSDPSNVIVFIFDPMLATGGSAYEAIKTCISRGIKEENITFICIIAAPEGIKKLREAYPKIKIVVASIDRQLNTKAFILPGLGDAGDRTFGTNS